MKRTTALFLVLAVAASLALAAPAAAVDASRWPFVGGLDPRFGSGGIAETPLSPTSQDRFLATAVARDGKTYAAGFLAIGTDQVMALARVTPTGTLDNTFDGEGVAMVNVAVGGTTAELARGMAVQSTGKIVVGGPMEHAPGAPGDAGRDTDISLTRFTVNGALDPTFGNAGTARIDLGPGSPISATQFRGDTMRGVTVLPNDKIVAVAAKRAAGSGRTDNDFALVMLTKDGALDTSFGTGGIVTIDISGGNETPHQAVVQRNGKIVMVGYSSDTSGVVSPQLVRVNPNGTLDNSFGTGGIATAKLLPQVAEAYDIGMQGNNFIIAGYGRDAPTGTVDLISARFTSSGVWDQSFGTNGLVRVDIAGQDDRARDLVVFPDGRVLLVGSGKPSATNLDAMLVMLTRAGALDTSFDGDGILLVDLGGPADSFWGSALTRDLRAVVAGYKGADPTTGDNAVVARVRQSLLLPLIP